MMNDASAVDLAALRGAIVRHIEESEAEIGVALRHMESGMEVLIDAEALYPMASVFKIPILVEALAQVGEGRQALDARVELRAEDRVPPSGVLVTLDPGLRPTLKDLLMLMIVQSDNMATDVVLGLIGLETVECRMRALGLPTISVKMSVRGLFAATFESVDPSLPPAEEARAVERQGPLWDAPTNRRAPENNVCSPRDMALLLERLLAGAILSPAGTAVALDILLRQQINGRIPRFLPPTVAVAHKTGTFIQSRNDAGIIYLPDGTHLVLALFAIPRRDLLEADPLSSVPYIDRVDGAMGRIARAAYDAFAAPARVN